MNVADDNIIRFECLPGRRQGFSASMVYAAQRMRVEGEKHDGRGLIVAILLCMVCWAALGYALLS